MKRVTTISQKINDKNIIKSHSRCNYAKQEKQNHLKPLFLSCYYKTCFTIISMII